MKEYDHGDAIRRTHPGCRYGAVAHPPQEKPPTFVEARKLLAEQGRADSAPTPAPEAATPFRSREADDAGEGSGGVLPGAFPCASALGLVTRDWLARSVNRLPPLASHRLDNASGEQGQSVIY
jgi:cellulase/cellobiase CelA1